MAFSIFKLCIASCIPVLAALLFYYLEKNTKFGAVNYSVKQIIIGICFGFIAVLGTEWGIPLNGVMINCRDAAPVAAGLLFGGPAGIIAGIIGGVERWIAVAWGVGSFTRLACSLSTILSGFFAALLRNVLFDNKRPTWGMALGAGIIAEVFHMCMVFITNTSDATKALSTVNTCFLPMVSAVGLSVMFSCVAVSVYAGDFTLDLFSARQATPIFQTIQRWLLVVIALSFILTIGFAFVLQDNISQNESMVLINNTLNEMSANVEDATNRYMIEYGRLIGREIAYGNYDLYTLSDRYHFTEINVVNEDGIIVDSNIPEYIGFDMRSGEQSAEFLCLLDGTKDVFTQPYCPTTHDASISRKYAGIRLNAVIKGFIQVGYDAKNFQDEIGHNVTSIATNQLLGKTGGIIVLDNNSKVVSSTKGLNYKPFITDIYPYIDIDEYINFPKIIKTDNQAIYLGARQIEGYTILAFYPLKEATQLRDVSVYLSLLSMLMVFALMFALLYLLIKKVVVNQITKMTHSLAVISQGNLNEVVDVRSNKEFSSLSDDINTTVNTLKRYIAEAAARIDKELEFAKVIQSSALPTVFPERDDYEIHAFMRTAKEVGGDFYDFYMTDEDTINFLIADVSGKGIPAAMFMMKAKAILKSNTEHGLAVDEVFTQGNNMLCNGNEAGMFVTAWQGILNLNTGHVSFANAGHNLPAIKHKDGKFEFLKQKINLVLGGMEDIPYSNNEITLEPGDTIFLYTDGITEATDADNNMFGDDRLLNILNANEYPSTGAICEAVTKEIDTFVNGADQFDDITMLAFTFNGRQN